MSKEIRVHLKVDQYSRIRIRDVISVLKGLRGDTNIKIVQESEVLDDYLEPKINNESSNKAQQNTSTNDSFNKSASVRGNTNLPQIRELNEIAALLRSMDMQQQRQSS